MAEPLISANQNKRVRSIIAVACKEVRTISKQLSILERTILRDTYIDEALKALEGEFELAYLKGKKAGLIRGQEITQEIFKDGPQNG